LPLNAIADHCALTDESEVPFVGVFERKKSEIVLRNSIAAFQIDKMVYF
jgi:hypothetical protein